MAKNNNTKYTDSLYKKFYDGVIPIPKHIKSMLDDSSKFLTDNTVNVAVLLDVGNRLKSTKIKDSLADLIYEILKMLSFVDWERDIIWDKKEHRATPRVVLSTLYYDNDVKENDPSLWFRTFIDDVGCLEDFYTKYLADYIPSLDTCKSLIDKASKGTLVYTDLPLVHKLDDPNLKLIEQGKYERQDKPDNVIVDNIVKFELSGNSKDYIMSRLKRDAELGDSKAQEIEKKVREGKFTSARQVALEMGYRKPVKQKCLPMDVEKAVDKIIKQMGEVYADELCTALYQRLRELSYLQQSEEE